jgi:hypothetical protein
MNTSPYPVGSLAIFDTNSSEDGSLGFRQSLSTRHSSVSINAEPMMQSTDLHPSYSHLELNHSHLPPFDPFVPAEAEWAQLPYDFDRNGPDVLGEATAQIAATSRPDPVDNTNGATLFTLIASTSKDPLSTACNSGRVQKQRKKQA